MLVNSVLNENISPLKNEPEISTKLLDLHKRDKPLLSLQARVQAMEHTCVECKTIIKSYEKYKVLTNCLLRPQSRSRDRQPTDQIIKNQMPHRMHFSCFQKIVHADNGNGSRMNRFA